MNCTTLNERISFNYIAAAIFLDAVVIIANVIELLILIKKWKRLDRIEHILFSLCLSDLFAGITAFAQDSKQLKEIIEHCKPNMDNLEAYVYDCLFFFVVFSTNFHVTSLAIERLVAVVLPLRYSLLDTSKCRKFTIFFLWVFSMMLAPVVTVVMTLVPQMGHRLAGIILAIICSVVFIAYLILVIALIIRERNMTSLIPLEMRKKMRDRRTTFICLVIGFAFLVCILPKTVGFLIEELYHDSYNLLLMINHIINPLIYFAKVLMERRRRSSGSFSTRLLSSRSLSVMKS